MPILPDALEESRRIVAEAASAGLTMRLLGGLAIRLHAPSATHRALVRTYPDLDFALAEKRPYKAEELFAKMDYAPNKTFNLLNGSWRLLFFDETHKRQIDIFVGGFHMCHRIPLSAARIAADSPTLPLAELLLTKLQIFQLNEKDVRDLVALIIYIVAKVVRKRQGVDVDLIYKEIPVE